MIILYAILLFAFSLYSYALVDPNITFFNNAAWTQFRNAMVQLGYFQRIWSASIFVAAVIILTAFHFYLLKHYKKVSPFRIAVLIGFASVLAYPFLSHDIFNYIFDARIVTHYHQNPYMRTALDFPGDQMTRFMHWTHRTYPYGPSFLLLTLIPSFLSMGKFILGYVLFKLMSIGSYLLAVWYLNKWNKEWAVFFATQPLLIIDGLINAHNDIFAVSAAIVGLYYVFHKSDKKGRLILLVSGLIKYSTLPTLLMTNKKNDILTRVGFAGILGVLLYLSFFRTLQPWYFLTLLVLIPYCFEYLRKYCVFFAGVLLSYTDYIATGEWHQNFLYVMIIGSLVVNFMYVFIAENRRRV